MRCLALVAAAAALAAACRAEERSADQVVLVGTHTLEDSGLLDTLVATFRAEHPDVTLRVVVSGTGEALEYARGGSVDVLLVHAPDAEMAAVRRGVVADRRELMHNEFLIAGPEGDPAGIRAMTDAAAALGRIADSGARFVSRDDRSGTNLRELQLWEAAGRAPPAGQAYIRAGVGMADALRIADARNAYVLTDPATFAMLDDELTLVPLVQGDPRLRNTYSVMRATNAPHPANAAVLLEWLGGESARDVIGSFGRDRLGRALFQPVTRRREGGEEREGREGDEEGKGGAGREEGEERGNNASRSSPPSRSSRDYFTAEYRFATASQFTVFHQASR